MTQSLPFTFYSLQASANKWLIKCDTKWSSLYILGGCSCWSLNRLWKHSFKIKIENILQLSTELFFEIQFYLSSLLHRHQMLPVLRDPQLLQQTTLWSVSTTCCSVAVSILTCFHCLVVVMSDDRLVFNHRHSSQLAVISRVTLNFSSLDWLMISKQLTVISPVTIYWRRRHGSLLTWICWSWFWWLHHVAWYLDWLSPRLSLLSFLLFLNKWKIKKLELFVSCWSFMFLCQQRRWMQSCEKIVSNKWCL